VAPDRLGNSHADADSSFELLYRGHRADVFRAALRELGNVHDAEDVTQAAFVDAYRAVRRGTRPESPRAWLLAIAENVRRRRFRTSQRRPREEPLDEHAAAAAEEPHERAAALLDALAELPAEQREAFLLREIAGLSYDEIAGRTEATVPAVQMLLFRARRTLRQLVEPPHVRSVFLPFPAWLASFSSRLDAVSVTPRAAGAAGAVVLAVAGAGAGITAGAGEPEPPANRAAPAPLRAVEAPRVKAPPPAPPRPAAPAPPPAPPRPSAPPAAAPAPVPAPAAAQTVAAAPAREEPPAPQPVPAAPLLPLDAAPELLSAPELSLPEPPPLLEPVLELLLGDGGAAGAAGADAPPLPAPPPVTVPPIP
jgi:RNA polymerase sigma-70 factor (ECF subfamily)